MFVKFFFSCDLNKGAGKEEGQILKSARGMLKSHINSQIANLNSVDLKHEKTFGNNSSVFTFHTPFSYRSGRWTENKEILNCFYSKSANIRKQKDWFLWKNMHQRMPRN